MAVSISQWHRHGILVKSKLISITNVIWQQCHAHLICRIKIEKSILRNIIHILYFLLMAEAPDQCMRIEAVHSAIWLKIFSLSSMSSLWFSIYCPNKCIFQRATTYIALQNTSRLPPLSTEFVWHFSSWYIVPMHDYHIDVRIWYKGNYDFYQISMHQCFIKSTWSSSHFSCNDSSIISCIYQPMIFLSCRIIWDDQRWLLAIQSML